MIQPEAIISAAFWVIHFSLSVWAANHIHSQLKLLIQTEATSTPCMCHFYTFSFSLFSRLHSFFSSHASSCQDVAELVTQAPPVPQLQRPVADGPHDDDGGSWLGNSWTAAAAAAGSLCNCSSFMRIFSSAMHFACCSWSTCNPTFFWATWRIQPTAPHEFTELWEMIGNTKLNRSPQTILP